MASKLDPLNSCWNVVNNIGNDMLFVGYNLSFSVPSYNFPGYRRNRIYFTDNSMFFEQKEGRKGNAEMGVYNLEDGSIEPLPGFHFFPGLFGCHQFG